MKIYDYSKYIDTTTIEFQEMRNRYVSKGKIKHSIYPGLDLIDLFERVVFNFIAGNSDMHLKNYSIIETPKGMRFSPAYVLLSTFLVIPEDREESALTINGKKSNLKKTDFKLWPRAWG